MTSAATSLQGRKGCDSVRRPPASTRCPRKTTRRRRKPSGGVIGTRSIQAPIGTTYAGADPGGRPWRRSRRVAGSLGELHARVRARATQTVEAVVDPGGKRPAPEPVGNEVDRPEHDSARPAPASRHEPARAGEWVEPEPASTSGGTNGTKGSSTNDAGGLSGRRTLLSLSCAPLSYTVIRWRVPCSGVSGWKMVTTRTPVRRGSRVCLCRTVREAVGDDGDVGAGSRHSEVVGQQRAGGGKRSSASSTNAEARHAPVAGRSGPRRRRSGQSGKTAETSARKRRRVKCSCPSASVM